MTDLIQPYRKVSRLGKIGARSRVYPYEEMELPLRGGRVAQLNIIPPQLRRLAARVGDRRAKRIWEVISQQVATIPEAIAYAWLEDRGFTFDFQSSQLGGLHVRGGAVVDFLIYNMSHEGYYIWRVQGEHWHQSRERVHADRVQKGRLLTTRIQGVPVVAVVDLWEDDLYDRWPEVCEKAEYGEEIRNV